ncbi:DUF2939 domain-containing protein [Noviherbaspirillum sp. Root189]|uniref:DUF2939 domain-containing protein n=1 Tax=Noviherbaspirillum sp. Root189 TaxID=1736487 RepID=UPI00070E396E|nr:DUF2939 domain-containing protein [Noviherbaspirillum sp. Root189]KRB92884.1 hypothetical protein ASE07_14755 [Noviherbaspirillum sp. Root189]
MKKVVIVAVALVSLLGMASYFSPHWTLYRMRSAVESRDYKAFSSYVDFTSLRNSFKQQMTGKGDDDRVDQDNGNPLEPLTRAIVSGLAGPLIDVMLTPAGVIEMLGAGKPGVTQSVVASTVTQVPNISALPDMKLSYRGWDNVLFRAEGLPEASGYFVLQRQGWWTWKLAAVELNTATK